MNPVDSQSLVRQLQWRYATKKFDPNRRISPTDWQSLEEALVLSPSSFGLQPWRFFVVDNPAVRQQIRAAAWNQAQVTDASHLVVFAARRSLSPADVDRLISRIVEVRNVAAESLAGYRDMMRSSISRPDDALTHWNARQVYLALGNFLTAAAMLGIDTCPLEGFEPPKVDEILDLPAKGFTAVVLATAGYRAADDRYAQLAKVRYPKEEIIVRI